MARKGDRMLYRTSLEGVCVTGDGIPLVLIPAGQYHNLGEQHYHSEVAAFWIMIFPVSLTSFVDFVRCGDYAKYRFPANERDKTGYTPDSILRRLSTTRQQEGLPFALGVDYREALAWGQKRTMRLPTETEWEIAMLDHAAVVESYPAFPARSAEMLRSLLSQCTESNNLLSASGKAALSQAGCMQLFDRVAEWTVETTTKNVFMPQPDTPTTRPDRMVIRGHVRMASAPSARLRRSLSPEKTMFDSFPVGFRCVIEDTSVQLNS
jgi:formylglycine-generating enzyme required for sulfatase activity